MAGSPEAATHCWKLTRNCAMRPTVFAIHLAALAMVALIVGVGFLVLGYPLVFAFSAIQAIALLVALRLYARHAADGERVELSQGVLSVHAECGTASRTHRFPAAWTRVEASADDACVWVCCGARRLAIGQQLPTPRCRQVAAQIVRALQACR
jgi:uncharacterized membrane protein